MSIFANRPYIEISLIKVIKPSKKIFLFVLVVDAEQICRQVK